MTLSADVMNATDLQCEPRERWEGSSLRYRFCMLPPSGFGHRPRFCWIREDKLKQRERALGKQARASR